MVFPPGLNDPQPAESFVDHDSPLQTGYFADQIHEVIHFLGVKLRHHPAAVPDLVSGQIQLQTKIIECGPLPGSDPQVHHTEGMMQRSVHLGIFSYILAHGFHCPAYGAEVA
jgi:hypothetical protein